jgi:hypothetical protein
LDYFFRILPLVGAKEIYFYVQRYYTIFLKDF